MCDQGRLGGPNSDLTKSWTGSEFHRFEKPKFSRNDSANQKLEAAFAKYHVPRTFINNVWKVGDELTDILIKKQADYGPHNIGQAPGGALNGLIVRIHDKISRIKHLTSKDFDPQNESLRDSYIDLANYALIALMVLDGTWPKE